MSGYFPSKKLITADEE